MSVNRELSLLKPPFNNRAVRLGGEQVVYFRGNTLITLNVLTGESESRDLLSNHAKIRAIACHPKEPLIAVAIDSGRIYLYDFKKNLFTAAHNEHSSKDESQWIGLHITADGGVVSVMGSTITHYCTVTKKTKSSNLFAHKTFKATEMSATNWNTDLLAIGSYSGLVCIVSIKELQVKYSFRGHDYQITSIVWMRNGALSQGVLADDEDDCFDVYNDANFRDDFGVGKQRVAHEKVNEEVVESPPATSTNKNFDFVEACQTLKEEMLMPKNGEHPATPQRLRQPDRDECQRAAQIDASYDESDFSRESNASSDDLENMFEKIDLNEVDDLNLITLDQQMKVWVWDVRLNCAKGSFKISSRGGQGSRNAKQAPSFPAQMYLLGDNRTIVGNTCHGSYFSLNLLFDVAKNKLEFDYQVKQNSGPIVVMSALDSQQLLTYTPYQKISVMRYESPAEVHIVRQAPVYNYGGRSIAVSGVNPMRIAVGTNELCFFDLTTITDSDCGISRYYKNIKSAVVCLAWHPKEEILAFGTIEGRIGLYNAQTNSVELLKPFSGNEVYHLSFGEVDSEVQLFACCAKGSCVVYSNKFSDYRFIFQNIVCAALLVDNATQKLFVGTKTGEVYHMPVANHSSVVNLRPLKVSSNYVRMFRVNCDHSKVVVLCKNSDAHVFSMEELQADPAQPQQIIKLKGHTQPIVWVDVSSKNPDLIVSAGYDSTIRIWDLKQNVNSSSDGGSVVVTATACYQFNVKLKYALFSPLDENCLLVGTQVTPLYVFNRTTKTTDFPPIIVNLKSVCAPKAAGSVLDASKANLLKEPPANATTKSGDAKIPAQESTIFYLAKRECRPQKVMECLQSMLESGDEESGKVTDFGLLHEKIFSDDLDQVRKFLAQEVRNYKASNMKSRGTELVAVMGGCVRETLAGHIRNGSVTEEMVGIAPMVSHNFWKLCSEAFAMQLIEEGQPLRAVLYLLCLNKVDEALDVLMKKHFYREAWVLAKLRRPKEDPIFGELAKEWIRYLDITGDYESAAVVAVGVGDYRGALDELMKRREHQLDNDHLAVIKLLEEKSDRSSK